MARLERFEPATLRSEVRFVADQGKSILKKFGLILVLSNLILVLIYLISPSYGNSFESNERTTRMGLDHELREQPERLLKQSPLEELLKAAWNAEDAAIERMREEQAVQGRGSRFAPRSQSAIVNGRLMVLPEVIRVV